MDITLALDYLRPAAIYTGSLTANTIEAYESILWQDERPKPTWAELEVASVLIERVATWEHIKAHRDRLKSGGVLVDGYWFYSDDPSRIQQIGLVMMGANLPAGIMWKTMSGVFVEMVPALATKIFNTLAQTDIHNFAVAEQHRAALEQAADPLAYDYSAGWLPGYADSEEIS